MSSTSALIAKGLQTSILLFGAYALFVSPLISHAVSVSTSITIPPNDPHIWYHGRWDTNVSTWWQGAGFTLYAKGLTNLTVNVGSEYTTWPSVLVGVSVDYGEFEVLSLSPGANQIPLTSAASTSAVNTRDKTSVIRLVTEDWSATRLQLLSLVINQGAELKKYKPSDLSFQFIGDSFSAGYLTQRSVLDAWTFLISEEFKAEHSIQAQSGACLADQFCYGNYHGISFQFWKTEDTTFWYSSNHNYTTPWDFKKDYTPTHVFLLIGANDNAYNIPADQFAANLTDFLVKLRKQYNKQPIFVIQPWGWPSEQWGPSDIYPGVYGQVVDARNAAGDKKVYLIDARGWITWDTIFHDNYHPTELGQQYIAGNITNWLADWGLKPLTSWKTLPN